MFFQYSPMDMHCDWDASQYEVLVVEKLQITLKFRDINSWQGKERDTGRGTIKASHEVWPLFWEVNKIGSEMREMSDYYQQHGTN